MRKNINNKKGFTEMTNIHGIRFLTEPSRPLYERLFWVITLAFICSLMVKTISHQIRNYLSNPVLMNINGKHVSITDVPFPAISLCSVNQVFPSLVNVTDLLGKKNLSDDEYTKLQIGLMLCTNDERKLEGLKIPKKNMIDEDLTTPLLTYGAENCAKVVRYFKWEHKIIEQPCRYLQMTITGVGICYTFNMLPVSQLFKQEHPNGKTSSMLNGLYPQDYELLKNDKVWSLDTGYKNADIDEHFNISQIVPLRLSNTKVGFGMGLSFLMDVNDDDMDEDCVGGGNEFYVTVHNPAELPNIYSTVNVAVADRANYLGITPKIITTSDDLRSWSPEDRGCYFNHERKLQFFSIYTIRNCHLECEANITFKGCKCSIFHHPRLKSTPICKFDQLQCFRQNLIQLMDTKDERHVCNCLPSCNELTYDIQYHVRPFKMKKYYKMVNRTILNNLVPVITTHKIYNIKSIQRVAVAIESDFLANIGGLMSLFLGFGVISLIEIVYFGLRWITDTWKANTNKRENNVY